MMTSSNLDAPTIRPSASKRGAGRVEDVLPLPLTPFELFFLLDDRPELPMTFCVEMVFQGQFDQEALQTAVDQAVARHPLLRSHVQWNGRHAQWVPADFQQQPIIWLRPEEKSLADTIRPANLAHETGLKICACVDGDRSSVSMHFHHACCDGKGARRFVIDLLTGYSRASNPGGHGPAWDELDYVSLRNRHQFTFPKAGPDAVSTSTWQKVRDAFHFHVLKPRPLHRVALDKAPVQTTPIQKYVFDVETTRKLRNVAKSRNATVNDVSMAVLFETLADWNRQSAKARDRDRLRVMMPMDLRGTLDDRMPAANRMSFSFVARTIGQSLERESLLPGIAAETRYIKQIKIGLDFLGGIALVQAVPGLLPLLLRNSGCMATALLSNSGDVSKRIRRRFPSRDGFPVIGNVVLDHVFGTPPIRPHTHAAFGLCVCSGQLAVSLLGNEQVFCGRTNELLQSFVNRWQEWS